MFDSLVSMLAGKGVSAASVQEFWRFASENLKLPQSTLKRLIGQKASISAFPYLALAAKITTLDDEPSKDSVLLGWTWYLDTLETRDAEIEIHTSPSMKIGQWLYLSLAGFLANSDNPVGVFDAAWARLFKQRQQSRFQHVGKEMLAPSIHLLYVGAFSMLWFKAGSDEARDIWKCLLGKCCQLIYGYRKIFLIRKSDLAMLFAFVQHVFQGQLDTPLMCAQDILREDDWLSLLAGVYLADNGVSQRTLLAEMVKLGMNPIAAGELFCQWKNIVGFDKREDDLLVEDCLKRLMERSA